MYRKWQGFLTSWYLASGSTAMAVMVSSSEYVPCCVSSTAVAFWLASAPDDQCSNPVLVQPSKPSLASPAQLCDLFVSELLQMNSPPTVKLCSQKWRVARSNATTNVIDGWPHTPVHVLLTLSTELARARHRE